MRDEDVRASCFGQLAILCAEFGSLCTIHHRAFDRDLVGVSPDYEVRVSRRLLEDEDGPMLDLLRGSHGRTIELPQRQSWRPDSDRLAVRFERFLEFGRAA